MNYCGGKQLVHRQRTERNFYYTRSFKLDVFVLFQTMKTEAQKLMISKLSSALSMFRVAVCLIQPKVRPKFISFSSSVFIWGSDSFTDHS